MLPDLWGQVIRLLGKVVSKDKDKICAQTILNLTMTTDVVMAMVTIHSHHGIM